MLADHVLLPVAGPLAEADERLAAPALAAVERRGRARAGAHGSARTRRAAAASCAAFLERRLAAPRAFVEEAERARR